MELLKNIKSMYFRQHFFVTSEILRFFNVFHRFRVIELLSRAEALEQYNH